MNISAILEIIRQSRGRDLSPLDEAFLVKTIEQRRAATAHISVADYVACLAQSSAEMDELLGALNICYSEFFRNPLTFALLEQLVLPRLRADKEAAGQTEIRVWSAGCAAGQEPYSLAILLEELLRAGPVSCRIIATDQSAAELARARVGVYETATLQNVPLKHLLNCFDREGDSYRLRPRIQERVDFSTYDLLDRQSSSPPASIYGGFDLVMCSNLLFYYRPEIRQLILKKIHHALAPGGYLATGEAEREIVASHGSFRALAPPGPIFQKTPVKAPTSR